MDFSEDSYQINTIKAGRLDSGSVVATRQQLVGFHIVLLQDLPFCFKQYRKHKNTSAARQLSTSNFLSKVKQQQMCRKALEMTKCKQGRCSASSFVKVDFFEIPFHFFLSASASESSHNIRSRLVGSFQLFSLFIHVLCTPILLRSSSVLAAAAITTFRWRKGQ